MAWNDDEDTTIYKVIMNHEEQYSIWPADRENPLGWNDVGKVGCGDLTCVSLRRRSRRPCVLTSEDRLLTIEDRLQASDVRVLHFAICILGNGQTKFRCR